jgi:hypothetical protein
MGRLVPFMTAESVFFEWAVAGRGSEGWPRLSKDSRRSRRCRPISRECSRHQPKGIVSAALRGSQKISAYNCQVASPASKSDGGRNRMGTTNAAWWNVGTVLLSHQPFSAHVKGNRVLRRKIPVLATKRADAAIWGHEHHCIGYGPCGGRRQSPLSFSSCLAHCGVPQYLIMKDGETKPPPWAYEYLRVDSDSFQPWGTFGFAATELNNEENVDPLYRRARRQPSLTMSRGSDRDRLCGKEQEGVDGL